MKRMLLFAVVALLPSCAVSNNPLTDPDKAQVDRRLMGVWEPVPTGDEKPRAGEYAYFFIGKSSLTNAPAGLMEFITVGNDPEGVVSVKRGMFFFATSLHGKDYASLTDSPGFESEKNPVWDKSRVSGYLLGKYTIKGDTLEFRLMNPEVVRRAILKGELKGKVEKKGLLQMESITLTASSEELCQFITAAREDELFPTFRDKKYRIELKRVK